MSRSTKLSSSHDDGSRDPASLPKIKRPSAIAALLSNSMTEPLQVALTYLNLGWRPIPITPKGKKPLIETWAEFQLHPPTGLQIKDWFTLWPDANVALVMGEGSGIVAVDLDSSEGEEAFRALCGDVRTLTNLTTNGRHLLFQHPGFPVRNAVKVLPGIDLRGDGGYIVVPPSIHPSGKAYRWANAELLDGSTRLPPYPHQLLNALQKSNRVSVIPDVIPQGERNSTLASLAGSLRRRGASREAILAALTAENETRCDPRLPNSEVQAIAASIYNYAPGARDSVHQESLGVRQEFQPRLIGAWLADPDQHQDADWILKGYVARGNITLLSGHPKAGKTTFAAHLAVAVARGGVFLNRVAVSCPVLWLDFEQHIRHTKAMFGSLGAKHLPIFLYSAPVWDFSLDIVDHFIAEQGIGFIVVDSLSRLWRLRDENDAVEVGRETRGVMALARHSNAGVLPIHHLRKTGGTEGLDTRGSIALSAAVDIAVQFRREGEGSTRLLESYSRYEETPTRLYVDFQGEKYVVYDNEQEVRYREQRPEILAALTEWLTAVEVAEATDLKAGTTRPVLNRMYEEGLIDRQGKGAKGDPYEYRRRDGGQEPSGAPAAASSPAPQTPDAGDEAMAVGESFKQETSASENAPEKSCADTIVPCRRAGAAEMRNPPDLAEAADELSADDDQ